MPVDRCRHIKLVGKADFQHLRFAAGEERRGLAVIEQQISWHLIRTAKPLRTGGGDQLIPVRPKRMSGQIRGCGKRRCAAPCINCRLLSIAQTPFSQ